MQVSMPLFVIGIKDKVVEKEEIIKKHISIEIILNLILGKSSNLYKELYNSGKIYDGVNLEYEFSKNYAHVLITGKSNVPEEVFDILSARVTFEDVTFEAYMSQDWNALFGLINIQDFRTRKVIWQLDWNVYARFDTKAAMETSSFHMTTDNQWNINILMEIPKPDLLVADVVMHDVRVNDNGVQRLLPNREMDKAYSDAYNAAIKWVINTAAANQLLYETARKSMENSMMGIMRLAYSSSEIKPKISVEVRYIDDWWIINYSPEKKK